jgi:hypothetical protein
MQRTSKRREERTEGNARPPNTPARPATVVTNQAANTPRWRIQGYERGSEAPSTHTHTPCSWEAERELRGPETYGRGGVESRYAVIGERIQSSGRKEVSAGKRSERMPVFNAKTRAAHGGDF